MKKILAACCLLFCFGVFAGPAQAADKTGIYVAPKFIYSHAVMDKLKGSLSLEGGGVNEHVGSKSTSESDNAWGGGLAVGYNFDPRFGIPVRAELEYSFMSQLEGESSKGMELSGPDTATLSMKQRMDIQTLFLNAYFDIKTGTPVTPYVGAGVGAAFISAKGNSDFVTSVAGADALSTDSGRESISNFAWNVGAGLGWQVTDMLTLDLGYRFLSLGEVETNMSQNLGRGISSNLDCKTEDLYVHQVLLTARFDF